MRGSAAVEATAARSDRLDELAPGDGREIGIGTVGARIRMAASSSPLIQLRSPGRKQTRRSTTSVCARAIEKRKRPCRDVVTIISVGKRITDWLSMHAASFRVAKCRSDTRRGSWLSPQRIL